MDNKFELELCGNDAVKDKLDGKSKLKTLCGLDVQIH